MFTFGLSLLAPSKGKAKVVQQLGSMQPDSKDFVPAVNSSMTAGKYVVV